MTGFNDFAPRTENPLCFVVMNITSYNKTIKIFTYPILWHTTRDLLKIPGVSESDIRASLLKGELKQKILAQEIIVVCSDIDLLQFNEENKQFLMQAGISNGLEVSGGSGTLDFAFRDNIRLIGAADGINKIFYTPEKFINGIYSGNTFHIKVRHNGKELYENIDYVVGESGGVGTGYDMINLYNLTPNTNSVLYADYVVKTL